MADQQPQLQQDHQFLVGANQNVPADISEQNSLLQILHWIGFRIPAQRASVYNDAFSSWDDIRLLTEKDINNMATSYAGRTATNGRITFGTSRTKRVKQMIHWVQDFYRVSEEPTIVGLDEPTFKSQLNTALNRATIRQSLKDQTSSSADAASPGPLEKEKQWKEWEEKFVNYCSAHIGAAGVPLSYVIRENEEPDNTTEHPDFVSKTIACAPLAGDLYEADRASVFKFIVSFTTGQPSGDWVKPTLRFNNGRRSMKALRDHFSGEGNATRNLAEAERLRESLHYRSERAMSFESFLTNCERMFNIFDKEGEPMLEDAKIRFLFQAVQHKDLQLAVEALKVQRTSGVAISYTTCANHLSTAVSELPEYIAKNRSISSINTGCNGGGGKVNPAILKSDGSIITGHIPNWRSLSEADRKLVLDERKRLGIGKRKDDTSVSSSITSSSTSDKNTIKQLRSNNKKMKRRIQSLKKKAKGDNTTVSSDDDDETDAGDQFGGRNSKKKKKQSK